MTRDADLIGGDYLVRFEARTLDDIRALGGNNEEDERSLRPPRACRRSISASIARSFSLGCAAWPMKASPRWMRRLHPLRLQYEMFSPANPFMRPLDPWMTLMNGNRQPVSKDNVFWQAQQRYLGLDRDIARRLSRRSRPLRRGLVPRGLRLAPRASARWPQGIRSKSAPQARRGRGTPGFVSPNGLRS